MLGLIAGKRLPWALLAGAIAAASALGWLLLGAHEDLGQAQEQVASWQEKAALSAERVAQWQAHAEAQRAEAERADALVRQALAERKTRQAKLQRAEAHLAALQEKAGHDACINTRVPATVRRFVQ